MMKNILRLFGVALIAVLFLSVGTGAAYAESNDYPTWTGNYARNAYIADGDGPTTNEVLWYTNYTSTTPLPDSGNWDTVPYMDTTPLVYNGNLYYSIYGGTTDSGIYCVNALTGKEVWRYTDDYSKNSMTIDDGVLYFGTCRPYSTGNGSLVALDANTGSKKWSSKQLATWGYVGISSAPVVYDDVVYLVVHDTKNTTCNEHLYAFNTATITDGSKNVEAEWSLSLTKPENTTGYIWKYSSPSLSPDGTLYVPGFGGCAAVNLQTKSVIWTYDAGLTGKVSGNNCVGTPVYDDGKIYLTWCNSISKVLSILDATTGNTLQTITNAKYIFTGGANAVAVTPSYVITCGPTGFAVLNKADLSEKYTLERDSGATGISSSPLVVDDVVYYTSYIKNTSTKQAVLNAFSLETGSLLWTYVFDTLGTSFAQAEATPAYSNGVIYVATQCGYVYAFYSPETIYDGIVTVSETSGNLTLKDVLNAGQNAGYFTYNASAWNTISDFNGIENTADYAKTWMCAYENNRGIEPFSLDDQIYPGAKIIYTYDEMNTTTWNVLRTHYKIIITAECSPEIIYEGIVIISGTSESITLKDVLDAAQTAGDFTYNVSPWNTISDFNGIENTADYAKTWMCAYENNRGIEPFSLDDQIYSGAKIIYTYDEMNTTTWDVLRTHYKIIITAKSTQDEAINLQSGWNFISTPKTLADANASQVFADIDLDGHAPMTWDAQTKEWSQISSTDSVVPLTGYWIYAKKPVELNLTYDTTIPAVPASTTVYNGWDAVGYSGSNTMTATDAFSNIDWASAWVWNVTSQQYSEILKTDTTSTLPKGSGIWLYVNDEEKGLQGHV